MLDQTKSLKFSEHDLEVIQEALFTQEKILSVQSRAGGNGTKTRLNKLQGLLQRIRLQRDHTTDQKSGHRIGLWGQFTRMLSC
jgi:hypothetical protein